jgi:hypothetical protein
LGLSFLFRTPPFQIEIATANSRWITKEGAVPSPWAQLIPPPPFHQFLFLYFSL